MPEDAAPRDLDVLRRRLYRAEAGPADVAAYRAAAGAAPAGAVARIADAPSAAAEAPRPEPRRRWWDRRYLLVGAGAVAALLVGVVAVAAHDGVFQPPEAVPVAAATPIALPASARSSFARTLAHGPDAGVIDWFVFHPAFFPKVLTLPIRTAEEDAGTGPRTLRFTPSPDADGGGHLTVVLTLAVRGTATWTASSPQADGRLQDVAAARATAGAGTPCIRTVAYTGAAPVRLEVHAPTGMRWDAVVVLSE